MSECMKVLSKTPGAREAMLHRREDLLADFRKVLSIETQEKKLGPLPIEEALKEDYLCDHHNSTGRSMLRTVGGPWGRKVQCGLCDRIWWYDTATDMWPFGGSTDREFPRPSRPCPSVCRDVSREGASATPSQEKSSARSQEKVWALPIKRLQQLLPRQLSAIICCGRRQAKRKKTC